MSFQVDPAGPSQTVYTAAEVDTLIAGVSAPTTSSQITDFVEAAQDAVAAMLAAGTSIALSYDDTAGTLTITDTGGGTGGGLDVEAVRDAIGVALIGAGLISVTVNDAADTITISTTATANSTDATLLNRANHTGTQTSATISDFSAAADARVAAALGVSVQAFDGDLTAIAGLTTVADRLPYATGAGTWGLATFTAAARTLLDDATVAAMRTTLGVPSITGATDIAVVTTMPGTVDPNTVYLIKDGTDRVTPIPPSATPTINCDTTDVAVISPLAVPITGITISGTPRPEQKLRIKFKDNGTSRAIAHGSGKISSGVASLLAVTVPNKWHREILVYDGDVLAWICMAVDAAGY